MLKVNLTQEEIQVIYEFLKRADLKGAEVNAYVNIVNKLNSATEDTTEQLQKEIEELKGKDKAQK